jgi:hypothetical protein
MLCNGIFCVKHCSNINFVYNASVVLGHKQDFSDVYLFTVLMFGYAVKTIVNLCVGLVIIGCMRHR